jgi:hypothetical protein
MKPVQERVEDAMREVGTLLIAFAPLDAAIAESRRVSRILLFFFLVVGIVLFGASLWLERRRSRVG